MLRVSRSEYLFDPLQQLLSPSILFNEIMCTREDTLTHNLGALHIDDVMSYNSLTTMLYVVCVSRVKT